MIHLKTILGIIAVILGVTATIVAIKQNNGGIDWVQVEVDKEPAPEPSNLKEVGVALLKDKVGIKEPETEKVGQFAVSNPLVLSISSGAILFAFVGVFTKRPLASKRGGLLQKVAGLFALNGIGMSLGLFALLWNFVLLALILALVLIALSALMGSIPS